MRHLSLVLLLLLVAQQWLSAQDKYVYQIDLQNVKEDRVKVLLTPPKMTSSKATFYMPSVIPGSYSRKDYGRFINDFKAFDAKGNRLKVKHKSDNILIIKNAKNLKKIEYWIDDTWDDTNADKFVFQPGGSNIEADKNFSINHHAFFGYFKNYKNIPFELEFTKPEGMFSATPLKVKQKNASTDILYAKTYVELVDNPVMICEPDTMSFQVKNTKVLVSVYSPNDVVTAEQLTNYLLPLGSALGNFFGTMPVDKYHFLFYFSDPSSSMMQNKENLGGFGALEHSYCSFYYLPEMNYEPALKTMVQDVCAHEFLHILTPLNVHSEEIEDFNFIKPKMSQHLWMYEGITEYFAMLVQVREGIIDESEFRSKIRGKVREAEKFKPLSFTKMSKKVLKPKYEDAYLNVYQKGALIGFALDLLITQKSNGKKDLKDVMMQLADRYGPNKPFKDKELIDEFVALTHPDVGTFFKKYVIGPAQIPYNELFNIIGWEFVRNSERVVYSFGEFGLGFDVEQMAVKFVEVGKNTLGLEDDDVLVAIEGEAITPDNMRDLLGNYLFARTNDYPIKLQVKRDGKEKELMGAPVKDTLKIENAVLELDEPTQEQLKYRSLIVNGKK